MQVWSPRDVVLCGQVGGELACPILRVPNGIGAGNKVSASQALGVSEGYCCARVRDG